MKTYRITTALAAALALTFPALAETTADDLLGRWRTDLIEQPSPDGSASAWIRQSIAFTPEREAYSVEAFADPGATTPLFTYVSEGPYRVVSPHETIKDALAVDLTNETSEVTIHVDAPDLWAAIGLAQCPLEIGKAVEISECVSGPPFQVADCVDLDLALVDEGGSRLRMGEGSVDRCTTRPDEAADIAFFRTDG